MKAISEAEHKKLCRLAANFKEPERLIEMETELNRIFFDYQNALRQVQSLIHEYRSSEKRMRQEMKRNMSLTASYT